MCKLEVFGVIEEINDYEQASGYYDQRALMLPDLVSFTVRGIVFDFAFFPVSSWLASHNYTRFQKPPINTFEISTFFCLVEIYMID